MNYPLISEYIEAIKAAEDNFEKLTSLRPVLDNEGQPMITSGNFAVVFKMKDIETGKFYALKCFTKDQKGRAEAYHQIAEELKGVDSTYLVSLRYLDKELFVDTDQTIETEFPVLLMDWVEGKTLDKYLRENLDDKYALEMLDYRFSQLAQWLIPQPFAHGDLKPDNILVREDGTLVLVDYDGMFVPAMKGQKARELGSPDFRHPLRTEDDFNELIDDFSITTILFSLYFIAKESSLFTTFGSCDRLLLSQQDYQDIDESPLLQYLYPVSNGFDDLYLLLIKSVITNKYLKDNDIYWLQTLSKSLRISDKVMVPKLSVSFNGTIFNMIYVEGGVYMMGAQSDNARQPNYDIDAGGAFGEGIDEGPVRKVEIESFWISESLITVDVWKWFQEKTQRIYPYNMIERKEDDSSYAVSGASYDECETFIRLLNKATNIRFDFPTEEEWEYAARGGVYSNGYKYAGSDYIDDVAVYGTPISNDRIPICHVKTKKSNELGIYDMSGGLYEWCKDNTIEQKDESSSTRKKCHHLRGGCMNSDYWKCRVSYKCLFYETDYYEWEPFWWQVGLRLVARNIDLNSIKSDYISSISDYATEEDVSNAIIDEYGAKYSIDGSKLISVPKEIVTYQVKQGVKVICHEAFFDSLIEDVKLPDSVQVIGSQAFWGAKKLKEIDIPNNVFLVGVQAFYGCKSLYSINLSQSINYIEDYGFSGCCSLRQIVIPENVDILEHDLLSFCNSLERVELPKNLTKISNDVFWNCKSLRSLIIPKNVNEIEDNPFRGSGISDLICMSSFFKYENGLLMNADRSELIACLSDKKIIYIPATVKIIRDYAFNGCKTIEQLFLPEGLTDIKDSAISDCSSLSELTIPSSVRVIHRSFLAECGNLKRLIIHSKDIWFEDRSVFYKAESLSQIIISQEIKDEFDKQFPDYSEITESY